jgi:deoxyadenosine/deoxycytidine kinase
VSTRTLRYSPAPSMSKGTYLEHLNSLYEEWIGQFSVCPVLAVPADDLDFVHNHTHLDLIIAKIQEKLSGKEEVVFA